MKRAAAAIACGSIILSACATSQVIVIDDSAAQITGTFSNLSGTRDGCFGVEVRVVCSGKGYEAMVQFGAAEFCSREELEDGSDRCLGFTSIVLVPVTFDFGGRHEAGASALTFTTPAGSPFAGKFEGAIKYAKVLEGVFTFTSGRTMKVSLPRGSSYWD